MNRVRVRAPGKAVLLGEYAVLEGAPALSMGVDRYARVLIEPCRADQQQIRADSLGVAPLSFSTGPQGQLVWDVDSPVWPALERTANLLGLLHQKARHRFGARPHYRVEIDTRDLYLDQGRGGIVKLGLGSSSAVAVALDAGLRSYFGGSDVSGLSLSALNRLLQPYRHGQSGNGSGVDLASSLCGGVIRYQLTGEGRETEVSTVGLPEGLMMLFVWTGRPASTPKLVERYWKWRDQQPARSSRVVEQMKTACERGQSAVERGDADALVEQIASYGELMGTIGTEMAVAIVDEAHAFIRARAEGLGIAYKPCGAGGGDLGMAAATDPGRLDELELWLVDNGFMPLALNVDAQGVDAHLEPSETTSRQERPEPPAW